MVARRDSLALLAQPAPWLSELPLQAGEKRAFEQFQRLTVPQLELLLPSTLWSRLAPQLSHHEPAVLYAMSAVGSMHAARSSIAHTSLFPISQAEPQREALKYYGKALSLLQQRISRQTSDLDYTCLEAVLITCILFVCMETLSGNSTSALSHLQKGFKIIEERKHYDPKGCVSQTSFGRSGTLSDLAIVIDAFIQARLRVPDLEEQIHETLPDTMHTLSLETKMSNMFATLAEAKAHLATLETASYQLRNQLVQLAEHTHDTSGTTTSNEEARLCLVHCRSRQVDLSCRTDLVADLLRLQRAHARWAAALDSMGCLSQLKDRALSVVHLKLRHFHSDFLLSTCRDTDEMLTDRFNDDFVRVLDLADSYLNLSSRGHIVGPKTSDPTDWTRPHLSLAPALIPSIYVVAVKCRDSRIRRRALRLLQSAHVTEGLWNCAVLWAFASRVVKLEEKRATQLAEAQAAVFDSDAYSTLPAYARFSDVVFAGAPSGDRDRIVCARFDAGEDGGIELLEDRFNSEHVLDTLPVNKVVLAGRVEVKQAY